MATFLKIGSFAGVIFVAMGGAAVMPPETNENSTTVKAHYASSADCMIKGNIATHSGEKIYYVPGQEFYSATEIRPYYGERWFCSEADARAAGWQPAQP